MNPWERGLHAGLVGDVEEEGSAQEVRVSRVVEEDEDTLSRKFHSPVLLGKLQQVVYWETNREEGGGGGLLPYYLCTNTERNFAEVLLENHPDMYVTPIENPTCAVFEWYEDVPEMVPINFTGVTCRGLHQ